MFVYLEIHYILLIFAPGNSKTNHYEEFND